MEYLVDGYNLMHVWDRDTVKPDALRDVRERLLDVLADFSERTGDRVRAVFDGRELPYPDRHVHRGVEVRFSRTPEDADRLLQGLLDLSDHARDTTVVSSDNAVRARAKASRARLLSSAEFVRLLRTPPPRRDPPRDGPALSESDVQAWAREFGVDPSAGAPQPKPWRKRR